MILIQEEVAPKRKNLCSPRWTHVSWDKKRFRDWVGVEGVRGCVSWKMKVICCWEDGQRKGIPVSRCHRDKRVGECVCSVSIQFKRVGMLNLSKSRISRHQSLWRDYWFYLVRTKAMVISIKRERAETDLRWARESRVSVNAGSPVW